MNLINLSQVADLPNVNSNTYLLFCSVVQDISSVIGDVSLPYR